MSIRVEFIIQYPDSIPSPLLVDMAALPRIGEDVQFRETETPLRVMHVLHLPHDVRKNARILLGEPN